METPEITMYGESLKVYEIEGNKVLLSIEDSFSLDYSVFENSTANWYIYAEDVSIPTELHVNNITINAHSFIEDEIWTSTNGEAGENGVLFGDAKRLPCMEKMLVISVFM